MAKKQVWKTIFKFVGIGAGICAGIVGLVVAFVAITGGFKPPYVQIKSCAFNIDTDFYQGSNNGIPFFVIDQDGVFSVKPNPDNSTELDGKLQIKSGDKLVKDILVEKENEDGEKEFVSAEKVGTKYQITLGVPFKIVLADDYAELTDTRVIDLHVDCENEFCDAKVFVDSKLTEFDLKYQKIDATTQDEELFEGDYIYAYIDVNSVLAKSSLTMYELIELTQDFKKFEFVIDNEEVASIEEVKTNTSNSSPLQNYKKGFPYAKIKILKSGNFKVSLNICNLYLNEKSILSQEDYDNLPDDEARNQYDEWLADVIVSSELNFEVSDIAIGSISMTKDEKTLTLFDTNTRFSASQLDLKVNPKDIAGSPYTSDDLKNKIADIQLVAGYLVSSDNTYDIEIGEGENKKYIKFSNEFISLQKEAGANEPVWAVTVIKEYNLPEQACLIASLTQDDKIFYDYIPVKVKQVQDLDLVLKNGTEVVDNIDLDYDKSSQEQTTYTGLSESWIFDNLSNQTFANLLVNGYPYKKVMYALQDEQGKFTFDDGVLKLDINGSNYVLTPQAKGSSNVVAIVFKTDINGDVVDANGTKLETVNDILQNGQIVVYSSPIRVDVHQILTVLPENTITLYTAEGNTYTEITNDDDMYIIKKDRTGSVYELTMYNGKKAYLKLNVNDAEAMKDAFNDSLVLRLDTQISQADKFVKLGSNLIEATIDGEKVYLLEIEINGVVDESLVENLFVELDGKQIGHLEIKAKKFILNSLTLSSNGTSETENVDADVYLTLSAQSDQMLWTTDSGKSQDIPLEVKLNKFPVEAEGHDEIVYKIYSLKDANFDISTLGTLTDEIIKLYFVEDYSILQIKSGYPMYDKDDIPVLQFNVLKAGKAIIIASCVRYEDNQKVFSNMFVVEAVYPYLEEQEFNYGSNYEELEQDYYFEKTLDTSIVDGKEYYTYDGNTYKKVDTPQSIQLQNYYEKKLEKYRKVVASYDGQLTNLLEFIGYESKASNEGGEGVEGQKIGLKWKLSNSPEVSTTSLRAGLYNFEIVSNMKDFEFVRRTVDGNIINYLKTDRVTEKIYIKIKISTKFGYELTRTYNYVLIPDYLVENDTDGIVELTASQDKPLFNVKIDEVDGKRILVNDGGLFFITNSSATNYRQGNENKITGYEGDLIKIVYLPIDMQSKVCDMLQASGIELISTDNDNIKTFVLDEQMYEVRFVLRFSYNDPNSDLRISNGVIKTKAVVEGISPEITINGFYSVQDGDTLNEYMESNIYKFRAVVTPIYEIKLIETEDCQMSTLGNSLETTFVAGKTINLEEIVKLCGIETGSIEDFTPVCELVGTSDNFSVNSNVLTMTGSIIESINLQISYQYRVNLENGLTKIVTYTLNLLVSPK